MTESRSDVLSRLARLRGNEIKRQREARGWSQAQLAEAAETTQQTVDRIERGVTGNSKALPQVQRALGLPEQYTGVDPEGRLLSPKEANDEQAPINQYVDLTDKVLKVAEGTHIPVYAMKDGGLLHTANFADAIPKHYPIRNVKDAYGIISREYMMEPVIRLGDIVIVNPNIPPIAESEVVFSRKEGDDFFVALRSLIKENADSWTVQASLDANSETFLKSEWTNAELIVSKISRVR